MSKQVLPSGNKHENISVWDIPVCKLWFVNATSREDELCINCSFNVFDFIFHPVSIIQSDEPSWPMFDWVQIYHLERFQMWDDPAKYHFRNYTMSSITTTIEKGVHLNTSVFEGYLNPTTTTFMISCHVPVQLLWFTNLEIHLVRRSYSSWCFQPIWKIWVQ